MVRSWRPRARRSLGLVRPRGSSRPTPSSCVASRPLDRSDRGSPVEVIPAAFASARVHSDGCPRYDCPYFSLRAGKRRRRRLRSESTDAAREELRILRTDRGYTRPQVAQLPDSVVATETIGSYEDGPRHCTATRHSTSNRLQFWPGSVNASAWATRMHVFVGTRFGRGQTDPGVSIALWDLAKADRPPKPVADGRDRADHRAEWHDERLPAAGDVVRLPDTVHGHHEQLGAAVVPVHRQCG
jgi:hypothetical protein